MVISDYLIEDTPITFSNKNSKYSRPYVHKISDQLLLLNSNLSRAKITSVLESLFIQRDVLRTHFKRKDEVLRYFKKIRDFVNVDFKDSKSFKKLLTFDQPPEKQSAIMKIKFDKKAINWVTIDNIKFVWAPWINRFRKTKVRGKLIPDIMDKNDFWQSLKDEMKTYFDYLEFFSSQEKHIVMPSNAPFCDSNPSKYQITKNRYNKIFEQDVIGEYMPYLFDEETGEYILDDNGRKIKNSIRRFGDFGPDKLQFHHVLRDSDIFDRWVSINRNESFVRFANIKLHELYIDAKDYILDTSKTHTYIHNKVIPQDFTSIFVENYVRKSTGVDIESLSPQVGGSIKFINARELFWEKNADKFEKGDFLKLAKKNGYDSGTQYAKEIIFPREINVGRRPWDLCFFSSDEFDKILKTELDTVAEAGDILRMKTRVLHSKLEKYNKFMIGFMDWYSKYFRERILVDPITGTSGFNDGEGYIKMFQQIIEYQKQHILTIYELTDQMIGTKTDLADIKKKYLNDWVMCNNFFFEWFQKASQNKDFLENERQRITNDKITRKLKKYLTTHKGEVDSIELREMIYNQKGTRLSGEYGTRYKIKHPYYNYKSSSTDIII